MSGVLGGDREGGVGETSGEVSVVGLDQCCEEKKIASCQLRERAER
jgi:hypothetical protein